MHRDFILKRNQWRGKKKDAFFWSMFFFSRRGLNGFTVCFSGAGSCIITCLLVRFLSSSASQLKRPSVYSYFRRRWHINQAARPLGSRACLCAQHLVRSASYWPQSQTLKTKLLVKYWHSPAGLPSQEPSQVHASLKSFPVDYLLLQVSNIHRDYSILHINMHMQISSEIFQTEPVS